MKGMRTAGRAVPEDIPKHTMDRSPSSAVRKTFRWSRISDFSHWQNCKRVHKIDISSD